MQEEITPLYTVDPYIYTVEGVSDVTLSAGGDKTSLYSEEFPLA